MEKKNPVCVYAGRRMREIRKKNLLTQEDLAHLIKIDPANYGQIERGQRNISINMLAKIAYGLRCQPCELLPELDQVASIISEI
jgi:transcriptional regulator with XRE-family HTH domain